MATIEVQPRETPAERWDTPVEVEVDVDLAVLVSRLEEWAAPLERWEFQLREGHAFGKPNNVEARLLFAGAEETTSLLFRVDQLETVQEFEQELWLTLDERDGIARTIHLALNGVDVELFHIVGPALGATLD